MKEHPGPVRSALYAGSWYPSDATDLRALIRSAADGTAASERKGGDSGALICAVLPHAGLMFSARGIAPLITSTGNRIDRVLILSPSHYEYLPRNILSVGRYDGYETPIAQLGGFNPFPQDIFPDASGAVGREHAVEMVLPFLAYLQEMQDSRIEIATALISEVTDIRHAHHLAAQVEEVLGRDNLISGRCLVIASSDFTHYGSRFGFTPFGREVTESVVSHVRSADGKTAVNLAGSDLEALFLELDAGRSSVCGIAGAIVVSALAESLGLQGKQLDYYTSLDVTGEEGPRYGDFVAYSTILWRSHD